MAIRIITGSCDGDLTAKSHWWGFPDLPEGVDFPLLPARNIGENVDFEEEDTEDLMTFICQIRLEELAPYDTENLLPRKGMLYFFAALDYFLGELDAPYGGLGFWPEGYSKVIYVPEADELHTHKVVWEDGSDACLDAEALSYESSADYDSGNKLLGEPFFEEVREEAPGLVSLLQIDEDDRWGLRFYDCGMLNFLISRDDLAACRFDKTRVYVHCM